MSRFCDIIESYFFTLSGTNHAASCNRHSEKKVDTRGHISGHISHVTTTQAFQWNSKVIINLIKIMTNHREYLNIKYARASVAARRLTHRAEVSCDTVFTIWIWIAEKITCKLFTRIVRECVRLINSPRRWSLSRVYFVKFTSSHANTIDIRRVLFIESRWKLFLSK